jgi:predicted TIM-barrel fold metal-dependent hydrolase
MDRRKFLGTTLATAVTARAVAAADDEPALWPEFEIVDPHHHLFRFPATDKQPARAYVLEDFARDIARSGHRVRATVAVEDYTMYRGDGPPELRSLGETEFLSAIAADSARGPAGGCRIAAGIVANVDLRLGARIAPVLDAHARAAAGRLRGIRGSIAWDPYPVMGIALDPARKTLLQDPDSRIGMAALAKAGLSLDTWCFHHQIDDVAAAARAVPDLTVILNHVGSPVAVGPYAGKEKEVFAAWSASIRAAARVPNLVVKLGGLGMQFISPQVFGRTPRPDSAELARLWKPYFVACIEAFGAARCMFETNYPPDGGTAPYGVLWNAFKRVAADASTDEKRALFRDTAARVYRLEI